MALQLLKLDESYQIEEEETSSYNIENDAFENEKFK